LGAQGVALFDNALRKEDSRYQQEILYQPRTGILKYEQIRSSIRPNSAKHSLIACVNDLPGIPTPKAFQLEKLLAFRTHKINSLTVWL